MYIKDKWLSDQFGYSVYNIKSLNSKTIDKVDKINKNNLIIYKTKNIKNKKIFLQKNNFKLIENTILFSFNIKKKYNFDSNCRLSKNTDKKELVNLSKKSFINSRFFKDTKIPKITGEKIKSNWIKNFFDGKRGNSIVVYEKNKKICGFILLIYKKNNLIIDLIAVNKKFRGKNIGSKLIESSIFLYNKAKKIYAGTQLSNKSSIRFYKKNKFRITEKGYTFHRHN